MKLSHSKTLFASFLGIFTLLAISIPVSAQAIGTDLINNFFSSILDTLKVIAPLGATVFIVFSAVKAFLDQDNPAKRGALITSVVISAVVLILVFGAETIVDQLETIAGA